MVRGSQNYVKCGLRGSGCTTLGGTRIQDIRSRVKEEAKNMENGLLILQGGRNYLERIKK